MGEKEFTSVCWSEFDRNDCLISKTKSFKTSKALKAFIEKLEQKGNFNQIEALGY